MAQRLASRCVLALVVASSLPAAQSLPPFTDLFVRQRAPAGFAPFGLAMGDVLGDAELDAVVLGSATLAALPGDGAGHFGAAVASSIGAASVGKLSLADFDADGELDAFAIGSDALLVALGDGAGHFTLLQIAATPYNAQAAHAVGDVTGDGLADVVTAYGSGLAVYVGYGGGQLAGPETFPVLATGSAAVYGLALADLDGDTHLDLVPTWMDAALASWAGPMLGDGTGHFGFADGAPLSGVFGHVAVGDLEGDGDTDAFVVTNGPGHTDIYVDLNDGTGHLTPAPVVTTPDGTITGAAVGDVDGDGLLDVAVSYTGQSGYGELPLRITLGGAGPTLQFTPGMEPDAVVCADLNSDGVADVAVADSKSTGGVATLLSDGAGGFLGPEVHDTWGADAGVLVDVDGDGATDALLSTSTGIGTWLSGAASNPESFTSFNLGYHPEGFATGDVNGDGRLDVATTDKGLGRVGVSLGDGAGAFAAPLNWNGLGANWVAVGDVNDDGYDDLLTADVSTPTLTLLPGSASGQPLPIKVLPTGKGPTHVELADMNDDGNLDAVYGHCNTTTGGPGLAVILGAGDYTFPTTVPAGSVLAICAPATSFTLGDLDADGHRDLVTFNGGTVHALLGDGTGLLVPALPNVNAPGSPRGPSLADLNGDGALDLLAIQSSGTDRAFMAFLGNGAGSFGAPLLFHSDDPIEWARAADLDADGKLDVAATRDPVETGPGLPCLLLYANLGPASSWTDLGHALAGSFGSPSLHGSGLPGAGSTVHLAFDEMKPGSATLVLGLGVLGAPFKGGVLVPQPTIVVPGLPIDAQGFFELSATWPAGLPSGLELAYQAWQADAAGPKGFSASNGLLSHSP